MDWRKRLIISRIGLFELTVTCWSWHVDHVDHVDQQNEFYFLINMVVE